jgi:NADPH-dependent 2,4-dienoyl-CoA reductase/sulfur reductase-like enzyme/rhodanese-related sulfurtransferase
VTVVEAREVFSYGACGLPYVLSGDLEELSALHKTPYGVERDGAFFASAKGVTVLEKHRALGVDVARQVLRVEGSAGERDLPWDELVLATGAKPLSIPGQPEHERIRTFHVWDDVKPLKIGLMRGQIDSVIVVGAGLVGCELAEAFHSLWGADVTLVEAAPEPLPGLVDPELAAAVAHHLTESGVELVTGMPVTSMTADDEGVEVLVGDRRLHGDVAVVAVGVKPAVHLARTAGVELGSTGAIRVDERMATSVPHVWAAGDCVECRHAVMGGRSFLPLGSLANRQGRALANAIAGRPSSVFGPVAGAMAVKVFDWNVAAVGATESTLKAAGRKARSVWISAEDCAHYWPEAELLLLKMVYDPSDRRVLGVQVASKGEAVKRVDVASQMVLRGATLDDVAEIEHAYAPPFAPALDPLTVLAHAALNQEDGIEMISPTSDLGSAVVLDVRTDEERAERPIEAGRLLEIEMPSIRERLGELPDEPLVIACAHGTRSAEIVRLLAHHQREACLLGGGVSWRVRTGKDVS